MIVFRTFPLRGRHARVISGSSKIHTDTNNRANKPVIPFPSSSSPPSRFEQIKLITFDVTGTLLTFSKPPFQIYTEFGKRFGLECDEESMKVSFKTEWKRMNQEQPHFGLSWKAWWSDLVVKTFQGAKVEGSNKNEETLRKIAIELIEYFKTSHCWKLKPDAVELITALQDSVQNSNRKLAHLGIISNFDPRLYILLKVFQMENIFSPIILSHECQLSKPSKQIFNLALSKSPVSPGEALHVGDNYELDYLGAINAGWRACLIGEKPQTQPKHQRSIKAAGGGDDCGGGNEKETIFPDLSTFHQFLAEQG